ncbi:MULTISPECIES: adhesin biosynthesis transcription regulatory family protein [unclassified Shewanella]|uniref:adhesin biosynthesis transcription regulatory family protein n=1 Tax=unclassified Shewanella TaxID=196818 RepID=UPI0021D935A1|nr:MULTISPECIES: adhesin biosynthesis transcription regulatory family protein [unclassified Shewanella]MCU8032741.1 adhesin biosynthesis transcription regulatory family protein [Shewanella sp. SM71]MCU8094627.1 adhesin biosynthesis transcription regulatory family protein [Shewanella sp. SM102]
MVKKIKVLIQGCEKPDQFELLLAMTGITSEAKQNALRAHLVEGFPPSRCYARYGVTQQHFSAALAKLNSKADLAMQYVAAKSMAVTATTENHTR